MPKSFATLPSSDYCLYSLLCLRHGGGGVKTNKVQHQNDKRHESLLKWSLRRLTKWSLRRLIVRKNAHDDLLAVGEGRVEVINDHVSIVTNLAIPADRIDEAATEARQRALERLSRKDLLPRGCDGKRISPPAHWRTCGPNAAAGDRTAGVAPRRVSDVAMRRSYREA